MINGKHYAQDECFVGPETSLDKYVHQSGINTLLFTGTDTVQAGDERYYYDADRTELVHVGYCR
jgi:hypothetical protein